MSDYGWDVGKEAKKAFASPTNLAAQRIGRRVPSLNASSSGRSVASSRSRRSTSVITTPDEADLFDQMSKATSVQVRPKKNKLPSSSPSNASTGSNSLLFGNMFGSSPKEGVMSHPGSPNSHGSNFSAEYNQAENYFAPGGALSIAAPGRPMDEKDFDWSKRHRKQQGDLLDVPPLDEKKTPEDGDERASLRAHQPQTANETKRTPSPEAENKVLSGDIFRTTESNAEAMETVPKAQSNDHGTTPAEPAPYVGSVDETGSQKQAPDPPRRPAIRVETVTESYDSDDLASEEVFNTPAEPAKVIQHMAEKQQQVPGEDQPESISAEVQETDSAQPPSRPSAAKPQHEANVEPQEMKEDLLDWVEQETREKKQLGNEDAVDPVESLDEKEATGDPKDAADSPEEPQNDTEPVATDGVQPHHAVETHPKPGVVTDLLDLAAPPQVSERVHGTATHNAAEHQSQLEETKDLLDFSAPQSVVRSNSLLEASPVRPTHKKEVTKKNGDVHFDALDSVDMTSEHAPSNSPTHPATSPRTPDQSDVENSLIPDPCGLASETLENIGSFMSHGSGGTDNTENVVERDAVCSVVSNSENQERISEVVASFSSTMAAVGLSDDHDAACASPCHEESFIDLRGDDDEFQLLARKAVKFLRTRLDEEKITITIQPSDRASARDVLPTGIRHQFFDALRYRLSVAPKIPNNSLDLLVLKCQELGLDVEGDKNPMVAALSSLEHPISFDVLHILENKQSFDFASPTKTDEVAKCGGSSETIPTAKAEGDQSSVAIDAAKTRLDVVGVFNAVDPEKTYAVPYTSTTPVDTVLGNENPLAPFGSAETARQSTWLSSVVVPENGAPTPEDSSVMAPTSSVQADAAPPLVSADRSNTPSKRDSPPPENQNDVVSEAASAFGTATNASRTDTENTPDAVIPINPFLSQAMPHVQPGLQTPYFAAAGPPSEISNQSRAASAISGLDSAAASTDPRADNAALLRLQAEIREAVRLAGEATKPETKAFWSNHAQDLQSKLDSLQRTVSRGTASQQSGAEEPVEEPRFSPNSGHYYAMDEENLMQQHHSESNPPQQMQPLEYESRMVDVIAPADLPGGYHFEAEIEGQRFLATVPAGGVQQGETFTCYMRELNSVAIDIPVGYWKDNMCQMCKHGLCHPTLWHGLFCPLIALGQITHRLQLDFLGRPRYPGTEQRYSNRFMMLLVTECWILVNLGLLYAVNYKYMRAMEITAADYVAFAVVNVCMYGFAVFVAQSTRSSIREKFMIREERCYDLEDVMCASTCLPCTVAQMARHTANYDDYEAVCCSKTGLPDGVKVKHTSVIKEDGTYLV